MLWLLTTVTRVNQVKMVNDYSLTKLMYTYKLISFFVTATTCAVVHSSNFLEEEKEKHLVHKLKMVIKDLSLDSAPQKIIVSRFI